ncbi:MAG: indole-3-glycerol phosphate synthase TrpC [Anaerolineae bacterium]|nr:indole-3-glycerol phosphate synthase TrpC [Anaerolineales bacterium]MCQ3976819.1 indole-3-glycerol phosphate synthase TrpC [Anaerolineae bacterium]
MTILDDIIKYKRHEELPKQMQAREPAVVRAEAALSPKPRDFVAALRATNRVALIGEVKKASPSKGLLRHNFDPVELAQTYATNGAAAISVLTDARYFQGKLEYLSQIRKALGATGDRRPETASSPPRLLASSPPLLRKDFIFHPYQVYEARAAGADALLLIAAVLNDKELADLLALTRELGLTALIEVHDRAELERVLPLQPRLIGVNNRDLRDFSVDLNLCIELRQHVPADICFVAESGIHTAADVARLAKEGIDAILVGEALVKSKDVGAKVQELASVMREM